MIQNNNMYKYSLNMEFALQPVSLTSLNKHRIESPIKHRCKFNLMDADSYPYWNVSTDFFFRYIGRRPLYLLLYERLVVSLSTH